MTNSSLLSLEIEIVLIENLFTGVTLKGPDTKDGPQSALFASFRLSFIILISKLHTASHLRTDQVFSRLFCYQVRYL